MVRGNLRFEFRTFAGRKERLALKIDRLLWTINARRRRWRLSTMWPWQPSNAAITLDWANKRGLVEAFRTVQSETTRATHSNVDWTGGEVAAVGCVCVFATARHHPPFASMPNFNLISFLNCSSSIARTIIRKSCSMRLWSSGLQLKARKVFGTVWAFVKLTLFTSLVWLKSKMFEWRELFAITSEFEAKMWSPVNASSLASIEDDEDNVRSGQSGLKRHCSSGGSPATRSKHALCSTADGHIYLSGGRSGNRPLKDLWRFDPGTFEQLVELFEFEASKQMKNDDMFSYVEVAN